MNNPKIEPGAKTELIEIQESCFPGDETHLLAAIKGWKDPKSSDTFVDEEASLCKSLDGIAEAIRYLADVIKEGR